MPQQRDEQINTHRNLRTKYAELREHYTQLRKGFLLVECAWCQQRIGWKRKQALQPRIPGNLW